MKQTLGTAYACPYCDNAEFDAPQAYRRHLETVHGERPDTASASAAVQQLHEQLARLNAKHGALPGREGQS